jgi:acetylornithine deacetylase/succinyl-diaminopimelate desuccinylase-like protein
MGRGRRQWAALVALALSSCSAGFAPPVDGARAWRRVETQVGFGPRIPGTPGHARMREWLVAELRRLGGEVEEQRFTDSTLGRPLELTNVLARWKSERGRSSRRVTLCAHWDSRPWCDEDPDPAAHTQPCPGANDGGSGVAVLLEVAECLAARPAPIEVELAFFDGEDLGRPASPEEYSLGARGYAARLPARGDPHRPVAAFLFDMVGDRELTVQVEGNSAERALNLVRLVLEGARATGSRAFRDEVGFTLTDDHLPLLEAGLPAVDIIDFQYPAWHTRADLPDQVSPESLAEVSRVAAWLVYRSRMARH